MFATSGRNRAVRPLRPAELRGRAPRTRAASRHRTSLIAPCHTMPAPLRCATSGHSRPAISSFADARRARRTCSHASQECRHGSLRVARAHDRAAAPHTTPRSSVPRREWRSAPPCSWRARRAPAGPPVTPSSPASRPWTALGRPLLNNGSVVSAGVSRVSVVVLGPDERGGRSRAPWVDARQAAAVLQIRLAGALQTTCRTVRSTCAGAGERDATFNVNRTRMAPFQARPSATRLR
jgi:hypothetical protein